jgi:hypothetical protein
MAFLRLLWGVGNFYLSVQRLVPADTIEALPPTFHFSRIRAIIAYIHRAASIP